jgi:hypothetical protein
MAKVTGPLFSLSASGQIAKMLVYMKWKGLDDVRKYVVPANPNSAGQQTQRSYFTLALNSWHTTVWYDVDLIAWNTYAGILAKVMSGFNAFVKNYVDVKVAGLTPKTCSNYVATPAATTATIEFDCTITAAKEATLKYGTSKTAMISSKDVAGDGTQLTFSLTGLSASTIYFCKVVPKDADERAFSGIYTFTTTA